MFKVDMKDVKGDGRSRHLRTHRTMKFSCRRAEFRSENNEKKF